MADGGLLLISCFPNDPRRPTAETAHRRNEFVAALADKVSIPYASPGGHLQHLIARLAAWKIQLNA